MLWCNHVEKGQYGAQEDDLRIKLWFALHLHLYLVTLSMSYSTYFPVTCFRCVSEKGLIIITNGIASPGGKS